MKENRIEIKGDKEGISVIVNIDKFLNFDEVIAEIISVLSIRKGFYKNSIIKIIASAVIKVLIIIRINAINDSGLLAYCFNLFIAYPPFYAQPKKSKDL